MREIVVLTEEPSIRPVFESLERKLDLGDARLQIITHNVVSDLERSLPRKLRGWRNPDSAFLVVRDNDGGNCAARKARLQKIIDDAGRADRTLIRIVCQELEAWFLGDRQAMHDAGVLPAGANPAILRGNPDQIDKPSRRLDEYLKGYAKIEGALKIAPYMEPDRNRSVSFRHIVNALLRLAEG